MISKNGTPKTYKGLGGVVRRGGETATPAAAETPLAALSPQPPGGEFGGGDYDSVLAPGIRNTRMIERAITQRWPIDPAKRPALLQRQIDIALDPNVSAREATSAFKTILEAEKQNQADEHKRTPERHEHLFASDDWKNMPQEKLDRLVKLSQEYEQILGIDLMDYGL